MPRWIAVIVVLLGVLGVIAALVVGHRPRPAQLARRAQGERPAGRADRWSSKHGWARDVELGQRVTDFVGDLDERVRKGTVSKALGTAPSYVVTGILMLFLLAYGRRYFEGFADQFAPPRRDRIRVVGQEAATRGRRYLLTAIGQSIVNGLVVGLTCWAVGLPAAVSLGFVVGVLTVLPLIGVLVGGLPALLLAFGLLAWWQAVIVLVVLLGLQAIEIAVVRPYVDRRTVRVGPTHPDHRRPPRLRALRRRRIGVRHRPRRDRPRRPRRDRTTARAARLTSGGRQRPEQ